MRRVVQAVLIPAGDLPLELEEDLLRIINMRAAVVTFCGVPWQIISMESEEIETL